MRSQLFTKYDFDPATKAFIAASGITDRTQQRAIDLLVRGFKASGSWSQRLAIYPFVGGTATPHAVNLKSPGTFSMVFTGATHSANGISFGGGSSRGDSQFAPSTGGMTIGSAHLEFYSRTATISDSLAVDVGTRSINGSSDDRLILRAYHSTGTAQFDSFNAGGSVTATTTTGAGLTTGIRDSITSQKIYRNGSLIGSNSTTGSLLPSTSIVLGNYRQGSSYGNPSTRQFAFFSVGLSMTDAQLTADYATIQAYQTLLGRQV